MGAQEKLSLRAAHWNTSRRPNWRDMASEQGGEDEDKTNLLYNFAPCPPMGKDRLLVKHILSPLMKDISEEHCFPKWLLRGT